MVREMEEGRESEGGNELLERRAGFEQLTNRRDALGERQRWGADEEEEEEGKKKKKKKKKKMMMMMMMMNQPQQLLIHTDMECTE